jgi:hypothetical protein
VSDQQTSRTQELLLLGEIRGLVQGLKDSQDHMHRRIDGLEERIDVRFDGVDKNIGAMDKRLRAVEQKAAVMGAAAGGAMSIGVAFIVEGVKAWLARH